MLPWPALRETQLELSKGRKSQLRKRLDAEQTRSHKYCSGSAVKTSSALLRTLPTCLSAAQVTRSGTGLRPVSLCSPLPEGRAPLFFF